MKKAEANLITGGLSAPSKMPCKGFSIPACTCNVGTMLRKVPGSTCSACYALKGRYMFPNVQRALQRRLDALQVALAGGPGITSNSAPWGRWLDAMGTLIGSDRFFRFHDSGDLQSVPHLELYCYLAEEKTGCRFWLPTRESAILRRHRATGRHIPANLLVRFSGPMLNRPAKLTINGRKWSHYSEVWTRDQVATGAPDGKWLCTAPGTGGKCADCRACWDPKVPTVIYIKH